MCEDVYPEERPLGSHAHLGSVVELLFINWEKSLFFLKNVHTFSSDIWTQEAYLQDPAAVTDSDETYNKHSPNMDLFMKLGTRRHCTQTEVEEEAPPIPVRLQAFCGGDGLGPEPLGCATVSWSDVSPRFSSTSLTRICLHG